MNFNFFQLRSISRIVVPAFLVVAACDTQTDQIADADHGDGTVASADGVPIKYDDYGVGSPALVLVHGW
jgi:hypothetical protein